MIRYAWHDLIRNPRRTLASVLGVALGVGLFSGVLFFIDGSAATMTARAIAPVTLDMQRIVTAEPTDLELTELVDASALDAGERTTVRITVTNDATAHANDVVVHDEPPRPLRYVHGSTTLDGSPVPDIGGDSPLSHGIAGFGMNIGRLGASTSATITYEVEATAAVQDTGGLPLRATVSSREHQIPIEANAGRVLTLDELLARIAAIPGVASADGLGSVDLPPRALASGAVSVPDPVRVFALDQRYLDHYASIAVTSGELTAAGALLSVEAARTLGIEPGATISLSIPGRAQPLPLDVTGTVDLAQAQPLFQSRKASKLEEFLYVPNDVAVSPTTFRDDIVPALDRAAAAVGTVTKSFAVWEADVSLQREPLAADPASALEQTTTIARSIDAIGQGQGYVIDNISNALAVASVDATTGRRMFLFLGLPGALLAAFLAAYAGSVLAATERREHATLRVRGATRAHLRAIVLTKALAIALVGAIIGVLLGLASTTIVLGADALAAASGRVLATSAVVAAVAGFAVTAIALFLPAHRSIRREVSEQRRAIRSTPSLTWRRLGLDVALLVVAVVVEVIAIRRGALEPPTGSVYAGVAVSLPTSLLPAPLFVWLGGILISVRALLGVARYARSSSSFGSVVSGITIRSVRRRSTELAAPVVGVGLVVAFGTSLALFASTYGAAKDADVRFALGSDLRITPSALAAPRPGASDASSFLVPGVLATSPVVFDLENAVLIGPHNQQRENLAAIDPGSFSLVAPLPDEVFVEETAADAMRALASRPDGMLVDEETADDLDVDVGDRVQAIAALGTRHETQERFRVVGLFERFPGMPEGANLVVGLDRFTQATGIRAVDFYLASARDRSDEGLSRATAALASGPGATTPIHVESAATALTKDASSLTAVNVNGLVRLNAAYALVMSATAIAIFVFGLLLQRRGEYIALRAFGLRTRELRAIVLFETFVVTACGLAAGVLVGTATAYLSVAALRGLFVLDPQLSRSAGSFTGLALAILGAATLSAILGTELLRRLEPSEILREE